ncbi:MAG: DUF362 domain-containing protein [Gemmatimonadetes bacterium]|nr:DUF362 domain-containing protein [Gemmatimonadota bacterium]MBT5588198.1 DUF362 domain-containing protein [Gemmatimonadota bacterium]
MFSSHSRKIRALLAVLVIVIIGVDLSTNGAPKTFVITSLKSQPSVDEPLQVDGLPLLRPGTLTLGEGRPVVAVVASDDPALSQPAPIDASLSYEQVDDIVRRALDLDRSGRSLRDVIAPGDRVLIKVNSVSNRGDLGSQGDCCSRYTHDGTEHPGQITDLRVVKSVVDYLLDHTQAATIHIAEGGSGSPARGKRGFPSYATDDSWSASYPEFADLSYERIVAEANARGLATIVDTLDLNYAPYRREPIPGGPVSRTGVTRSTYQGAQYGFHIDGTGDFRNEGFFVPEAVLDADKIISVPAMKTTIFGATLGIKNYVGTLAPLAYGTGIGKGAHAANNPEQGYVDLFSYNPAAYTVIEGFWSTEGNGPQRGDNVQHNVIIASADPVAADAVGSFAMGFNPLDLEHLHLAAAKGLGTLDMRRMTFVGQPPEHVRRDFVKSEAVGAAEGRTMFYGRGIRRWLLAGPFPGMDIELRRLPNEESLRPIAGAPAGDGSWEIVEHLGYSAERLQISEIHGTASDIQSMAFTLVDSRQAQEGFLWLGFDDVVKVIWNGETIFTDNVRRNYHLADVQIPIHVLQGENRLLLKVGKGSGRSSASAHIVDVDGDRLPGIAFRLPGEIPTAIEQVADGPQPQQSALVNLYPNPFNSATQIRFELARNGKVDLAVWDVLGRRVKTLVTSALPAGMHQIAWDGRADDGGITATGVYWVRLQTPGGLTSTRPITLLR